MAWPSLDSGPSARGVAEAAAIWRAVFNMVDDRMFALPDEEALTRLTLDLGAGECGGALSADEEVLIARAALRAPLPDVAKAARAAIALGADPLGDAFCSLRSPATRRMSGAIYTPVELIRPMVDWTLRQGPVRIVDAGAGSGRFTLEVARRVTATSLVAVDADPVATLMSRAGLAALQHYDATVINADYTTIRLPATQGRTAFLGNPPYVRHHALAPATKAWAQRAARALGLKISGLAGLHAYFFLATALHAREGDVGCFVTSAEWLDVNYGSIVRSLLLDGLGGQAIHVLEPTALPFADTATTAAISCFQVGGPPSSIRFHSVAGLAEVTDLDAGQPVDQQQLAASHRWTSFVRTTRIAPPGYVELGELCRVHRGAVTGRNSLWVTNRNPEGLPRSVLFPSVTRARELFQAGDSLASVEGLRDVIDLPEDLDVFDGAERRQIETFLTMARQQGAAEGYIARNRRTWWSVGLRAPAPILATYMARRSPAFVRNLAGVRHINIAHGIYPREPLPAAALDKLARALATSTSTTQGRTYAGGLTKFEPREMERLPVPDLSLLLA